MTVYRETLGAGPDLVLLHGWGQNAAVWEETVRALSTEFRVTLVDLPGHGLSPLPEGDYTPDVLAAAIADAVPARAVWLGWSLGGFIALARARQAPQTVTGLVLVASAARFARADDWPHGMDPELLAQFATELERDYRATLERFMALEAWGSPDVRQTVKTLRERLLRRGEPHPQALRAGLDILRQADLRAALPHITAPTLLLLGANDRLVRPEAGTATAAQLPKATVDIIAGAGHAPFLTQPERFVARLKAFLHTHGQ